MLARRTIHVVFDSNAVWADSESELLARPVQALIGASTSDADFRFVWMLPETVVAERRFRMREKARTLVRGLRRVEAVLGRELNVVEADLDVGVDARIATTCQRLSLTELPLDYSKVQWADIARDSVQRVAPFETGEHGSREKGFRDALIGETMLQHLGAHPDNPTVALTVLVTGDGRLQEMLRARTATRTDVRIAESIEALSGVVEEIREGISAHVATVMREHATAYFIIGPTSLWETHKLLDRIFEIATEHMKQRPEGADRTELGAIGYGGTHLVGRAGHEVSWESRVTFEQTAWRKQVDTFAVARRILEASTRRKSGVGLLSVPGSVHSTYFGSPLIPLDWTSPPVSVLGQSGAPSAAAEPKQLPDILVARRTVTVTINWSAQMHGDVLSPGGTVRDVSAKDSDWESVAS